MQKVLYAEDEPDIREVGILALEMVGGLDVCPCGSGLEVLEHAESFAPDIVLLDVMMPGLDGPSTFKALREMPQFADVPIVFLTAKVLPNEVATLMEMGALGIVAKPFDPMTLADEVRALYNTAQVAKAA